MPPTADLSNMSRTANHSVVRTFDAVVDSVNRDDMSLVARINTSSVDRYNTVISPRGGKFKNWRAAGMPVLWEHGKDSRRFTDPIANSKGIWNNGGPDPTEILAQPRFLDDDFSRQRFEWYRDGVIKGWSVNILPLSERSSPPTKEELRARPDWEGASTIYREWDLAEFSGTVVPGNAEALTSDRAAKVLELVERSLLWLPDEARQIFEEAKERTTTDSLGGLSGGGSTVGTALLSGDIIERDIKKEGDKWVVYSESGNKLGEHPTEKEAKDQLAAYYVHKDKDRGTTSGLNLLARYIRHEGDKWIVYSEAGKKLGEHDSEASAKKQLAAIEANKGRSFIEESGGMYIVRSAEGLAITATRDKTLADDLLETMAPGPRKTFERDLVEIQNQLRAYQHEMEIEREKFKTYVSDYLDLMIHGRV